MNKKIVVLHPAFWKQSFGGAEAQIKYLVEFLLKMNVEVHYIFEAKDNILETKEYKNLILHPLPWLKISKRFGKRWFLYKNRINKLLNEINPDGIYTRFFSSWNSFASDFSMKNNIPHIWALASDNDLKKIIISRSFFKPLDIVENVYVKKAFQKATFIVVQNNWQKIQLKNIYNRDCIYLKQAAPINNLPLNFIKKNNVLNIIWVANMKPLKRPDLFVQLANSFIEVDDICFTMIGRLDQNYLSLINEQEKNNPNFKYLGELNNEKVNNLLLNTDILVNTSDFEGFSNTFIQAWYRKNIVISLNSNPDDILNKFEVGFLCTNIDDVKEKIYFLRKNKRILSDMQEKAYEYSIKEHSLEYNLQVIYNLLKLN